MTSTHTYVRLHIEQATQFTTIWRPILGTSSFSHFKLQIWQDATSRNVKLTLQKVRSCDAMGAISAMSNRVADMAALRQASSSFDKPQVDRRHSSVPYFGFVVQPKPLFLHDRVRRSVTSEKINYFLSRYVIADSCVVTPLQRHNANDLA